MDTSDIDFLTFPCPEEVSVSQAHKGERKAFLSLTLGSYPRANGGLTHDVFNL